jgi:hypothetical protein
MLAKIADNDVAKNVVRKSNARERALVRFLSSQLCPDRVGRKLFFPFADGFVSTVGLRVYIRLRQLSDIVTPW